MKEKILIVEDEKDIARMLEYNLKKDGYKTLIARDGETALGMVKKDNPGLILLDLMLPGLDGLEVCKRIRAERNVPIIMLSARGEELDKVLGLELGADDYVTKPFNPRELVARVKAVLRRSQGMAEPASILEAGDLRLDVPRRESTLKGKPLTLRAKEFDLLAAFLQNEGLVMDRERLIQRVWGHDFYGDSRTIDVHVAWLREKLAGSSVQIQTVWGIGYKLVVNIDAEKPEK